MNELKAKKQLLDSICTLKYGEVLKDEKLREQVEKALYLKKPNKLSTAWSLLEDNVADIRNRSDYQNREKVLKKVLLSNYKTGIDNKRLSNMSIEQIFRVELKGAYQIIKDELDRKSSNGESYFAWWRRQELEEEQQREKAKEDKIFETRKNAFNYDDVIEILENRLGMYKANTIRKLLEPKPGGILTFSVNGRNYVYKTTLLDFIVKKNEVCNRILEQTIRRTII